MKRTIFITFILCLIPIAGRCQVSAVMSEYGDMLPSRGSFAVIKGRNFTSLSELTVDVSDLPTDLAGVRVDINGVPCGLRYVAPDTIRFVIPDSTPFIPPSRVRPNILTVHAASGFNYLYRLYINDSSPWLLPELNTEFPVGVQYSVSAGMGPIKAGVIHVGEGVRVQLWATGARSFYPIDWVYYYIYLTKADGETFEIPAWVEKLQAVAGVDVVTFDLPADYAGFGECRLLFRAPSAFSQEVKVTL